MELSSNEVPQNVILQLLISQNGTVAEHLVRQSETMERMRKEQNAWMEDIAGSIRALKKSTDDELVALIRTQSDTMKEQYEMSKKQYECIELLTSAMRTVEKNSKLEHDDEPFPGHDLKIHEPGWRAAFETLMVRMKDKVERWRNGMDSTLIFVALFVAVITAFQTPVSQNLAPDPADITNNILGNLTTMVYEIALLNGLNVPSGLPQPQPFRPDQTDQVVTLFWYSALLMSLIAAILSVFGRQWAGHLLEKPDGPSYKVKSWRLDYRLKLANKFLRPLLDSIQPILVSSIVLFIVGLLFQLWSISFSTGRPRILLLTSTIGSILILGAVVVTIYTFVHGVQWEESPFTTSTSMAIRRRYDWFVKSVPEFKDLYRLFCSAVMHMGETHHYDQISSVPLNELLESDDTSDIELALDAIVSVLESDASLKAKQTVAWNVCISGTEWNTRYTSISEKSVECLQRLCSILTSLYFDTPARQEKVKLTFFIARMIVILGYSGAEIYLFNLGNEQVKRICLEIFRLDLEVCIDREILRNAKYDAYRKCKELAKEDPHLFDSVNEDKTLLSMIFRLDVSDSWKMFVLGRFAPEKITELLDIIATASLQDDIMFRHFLLILYFVHRHCVFPLVFPPDFDLTKFIKFATTSEQRFDSTFHPGFILSSPVHVVLSYLSLMDNNFLSRQQYLPEFLESVTGDGVERPEIRSVMTEVNIAALQNRVALSFLPLGLIELYEMENNDTTNRTLELN